MKTAAFALVLLALLPPPAAWARHHHHNCCVVRCNGCGSSAFWAPRCAMGRATFAISNEQKTVDLLLDRRDVILQLSDRTMRRIDRELRDDRDRDEGFLANLIKGAVIDGVREMLDHSLRCPLDEVRDARYRDGRLILVTRDRDELFDDLDVDNGDVMASFSEADARAFVAELRRLKGIGS
ncbi:MAG TPA: hypothetical protein VMS88_03650 [Terriglobales bacterium]|nr:hypothetical protein [Terriglobales bacterium]